PLRRQGRVQRGAVQAAPALPHREWPGAGRGGHVRVPAFSDRLILGLTVTLGGTEHTIPPGDIRAFELSLWSWGLEGHVEFLVADNKALGGKQKDAVLADFLKQDLGEVSLEVKASVTDTATKPAITSFKVKGLIVDKTLEELPANT